MTLLQEHANALLTATVDTASPHTINPDVDRMSLAMLAREQQAPPADSVRQLLGLLP